MSYITVEKLRNDPYLIKESDASNTYLETLLEITKALIDAPKMCGQNFDKEGTVAVPVEKRVDGTGKDTIWMPKTIITLTMIRIYASGTNYTEYTPDNFNVKDRYISWNIYSDLYDSSRLRVENFPEGKSNLGVLGIWGFATVPTPIEYLQGRIIEKMLTDEGFTNKIKSERMGDYSVTNIEGNPEEGAITGDKELDLIIDQYTRGLSFNAI